MSAYQEACADALYEASWPRRMTPDRLFEILKDKYEDKLTDEQIEEIVYGVMP